MIRQDRARYHQVHPAKLLTDWGTAVLAGGLFWRRQPLVGLAVGVVPSVAVTWIFLSGRLDHELERVRRLPVAQKIAPHLSPDINALRFAGLALFWAACWLHEAWLTPAGIWVIVGGWWLAWRRGVRAQSG